MRTIEKDKINRILVIRTDEIGRMGPAARYYGLGESLLNIPAIRALRETFNSSIIVALVNPVVKELLAGTPEIDQILVFDKKEWKKSVFVKLKLLWQIRKMNFDLAVIFNPTKRFHVLTYVAGIPWRLGYNRKWGFLLTDKIEDKKSLGQKHEVEYNLDLVRAIGVGTKNTQIAVKIKDKDVRSVKELLQGNGIKDKDTIIAIHPHSSNPAKTWPKENFASIFSELHSRFNAKVVLLGAAQDKSATEELVSLAKYPLVNLCGVLTLKQLAVFLQRSILLISNDSGPVHIAAAMGTSTVVIFGRNIPGVGPKRWGPWGKNHIVLHKDSGCNPCLDRDCTYNFKCLRAITIEEVLKAAEQQLR